MPKPCIRRRIGKNNCVGNSLGTLDLQLSRPTLDLAMHERDSFTRVTPKEHFARGVNVLENTGQHLCFGDYRHALAEHSRSPAPIRQVGTSIRSEELAMSKVQSLEQCRQHRRATDFPPSLRRDARCAGRQRVALYIDIDSDA